MTAAVLTWYWGCWCEALARRRFHQQRSRRRRSGSVVQPKVGGDCARGVATPAPGRRARKRVIVHVVASAERLDEDWLTGWVLRLLDATEGREP
jgi:hypothetical protein